MLFFLCLFVCLLRGLLPCAVSSRRMRKRQAMFFFMEKQQLSQLEVAIVLCRIGMWDLLLLEMNPRWIFKMIFQFKQVIFPMVVIILLPLPPHIRQQQEQQQQPWESVISFLQWGIIIIIVLQAFLFHLIWFLILPR